jgi:CRP/FNR family transcriptional regulator
MRHTITVDCKTCTSRKSSIFCQLDIAELAHFDDNKSCILYKKGQMIFHEGSYPSGVYCINEGKVKTIHIGMDGKEQIIRLAKDGDIIGYRALLSGGKYNASAIALEDSQICFIPKETFFNVVKANSNLSLKIINLLASELGKAEQTITDLAQKTVRERLAEALLLLKETYGLEADGATINITLSREEVASMIGAATETTIRLLSGYKQEDIISFVGKKIKILNMPKLVKAANLQS